MRTYASIMSTYSSLTPIMRALGILRGSQEFEERKEKIGFDRDTKTNREAI